MKKFYFSFVAILFALFAMVSFTACSSSDDDAPSAEDIKSNIVGMWQTTHISGWTYDDTEDENLIKVDKDLAEKEGERYLFKSDGTCVPYYYSSYYNTWSSLGNYTYDVSGNRIIIYYSKTKVWQTLTVLSLKDDALALQYSMEEGDEYKTTITCKRVN